MSVPAGIPAYFDGLASAMGLAADRFEIAGVTVVPGDDRRGERLVSHYRVGAHSVLWIDPELAGAVGRWHARRDAPTFEEFRSWAVAQGAAVVGHGLEHLLREPFQAPERPEQVVVLDGEDPCVIELVRTVNAVCSIDDLAEADFDVDALDPDLVGWIDDGRLLAIAGGRPFEARPGFTDVGVLVHPVARRQGYGRAVIAAVVEEVLAAGRTPLYRCGDHNVGSMRLCRGLGFELVLELEAFTWPADI